MPQHARQSHFLGTKLRTLRKRNGLTLEELSARCIQQDPAKAPSVSYLSMIESGKRVPSPEVLARIAALSARYGLRVANVFHAGDGNLHPLILYDANTPGELERAEAFGSDILRLCVEVGGVLTGEHGVGVEKRDLMAEVFSEIDLAQQQRLKCAFDPDGRMNPGKVFPQLHRCAELGRMHVHGGRLAGAHALQLAFVAVVLALAFAWHAREYT